MLEALQTQDAQTQNLLKKLSVTTSITSSIQSSSLGFDPDDFLDISEEGRDILKTIEAGQKALKQQELKFSQLRLNALKAEVNLIAPLLALSGSQDQFTSFLEDTNSKLRNLSSSVNTII